MPGLQADADCVDLSELVVCADGVDLSAVPGRSSASRQLSRPTRSLKAMTLAMTVKASLSTAAGAKAATAEPAATPSTDGSAQARSTSIITRPLLRWMRNERMFVGTMMAIEVPTHSWKRTSSET